MKKYLVAAAVCLVVGAIIGAIVVFGGEKVAGPKAECHSGDSRPCGTDLGECVRGLQTCSGGRWGKCVGEIVGTPEVCDVLDNDCDGTVDEGLLGICACKPDECDYDCFQSDHDSKGECLSNECVCIDQDLRHVEISYRAPEGATWVTFLSSWTSWGWDEAAKSTDRHIVVSYNLSAGKYIFNLNYGGVAPYWACSGNPACGKPASMAGELEVEVDGQPVQVEFEDNHQCGCNLEISI